MATPVLRALRRQFPRPTQLIGVMRSYVVDVLAGTPWLDEVITYARNDWRSSVSLVRQLRGKSLDVAVLLTNSFRTAVIAYLAGAKTRVGYARSGRSWVLNRRLVAPRVSGKFVPAPVLDYYLELAYALGCPPESAQLELGTLPDDEHRADDVWRRFQLPPDRSVVTLNNGGAFGAAKLWPNEHFATLARRIAGELDKHVLVVCGPSERELARALVTAANHPRVVSIAEEPLSIGLTKACVKRSRLMVTTDSGPRHFAAAFDVPVITLFGPTHIAWSENHFARAEHLQLPLACSPCQQRVCPLGHHQCMRDLSPDRVFASVARELAVNSIPTSNQNRSAA
ncbi:MAG: lipopolysaccharide heptosyltransferase II [Planctomycetaceae bacterium]|nr:lipopolysaccharide heptosyltransferase II [Planctomycetaceae bacterium]